jgi:hypothetical protein
MYGSIGIQLSCEIGSRPLYEHNGCLGLKVPGPSFRGGAWPGMTAPAFDLDRTGKIFAIE